MQIHYHQKAGRYMITENPILHPALNYCRLYEIL